MEAQSKALSISIFGSASLSSTDRDRPSFVHVLEKETQIRVHLVRGLPQHAGILRNPFSPQQEEKLKNYTTDLDKCVFGLTKNDFAKVVYDFIVLTER
ncbi:hypothetical protein HHI36_007509 [Cryptolaemus montrouzieri]|uniref:Uncharacterized protein n=1 Tax=Cryptolaemus montrouzieri TaxID=559131 RepID=A0ABD2MPU7_9CUCU